MGALSLGIVSDYYLWELDDSSPSILRSSLPSSLEYLAAVYVSKASLGYSFWLLCGGVCECVCECVCVCVCMCVCVCDESIVSIALIQENHTDWYLC